MNVVRGFSHVEDPCSRLSNRQPNAFTQCSRLNLDVDLQELSSNHGHSTDVNIKQPNKMPPQKLSSGIAAVQKAPVPHSKEHVVMSQRIKRRMNQIALFHFMRLSRRIATQVIALFALMHS